MPLLAIRKQFVQFTGRYDLVTDDESWRDKGANFLIQTGQKWLDRQAEVSFGEQKSYFDLLVGSWYIMADNIRSVRYVYLSNADGERWPLCRRDYPEIAHMRLLDPGRTEHGCPKYYSIANINTSPATLNQTTVGRFGPTVTYVEPSNPWGKNAIVILPPTAERLLVEIQGLIYQPELVADSDMNVWSEEFPYILVLAACRQLEISYRNTSGAADWENAINAELLTLGYDLVDQVSNDITQIKG